MTKKITQAVARIAAGAQKKVSLGNLDAERDWGYAPEYVEAMWLMLQADSPDDFVVATGTRYSIRDFLAFAFEHVGLNWQEFVEVDSRFMRPAEVDALVGDSSKMTSVTGWKPRVLPPQLAQIMVDADQQFLESQGSMWIDRPYSV